MEILQYSLRKLITGIPLILGANIGTCVTAMLAAMGKERPALRAATVHVLFNVVGVLVWLPLITQLAELAVAISPAGETGGIPRQIANANTLFNIMRGGIFSDGYSFPSGDFFGTPEIAL